MRRFCTIESEKKVTDASLDISLQTIKGQNRWNDLACGFTELAHQASSSPAIADGGTVFDYGTMTGGGTVFDYGTIAGGRS